MNAAMKTLQLLKVATPIITPLMKWISPNNNFKLSRGLLVVAVFASFAIGTHFMGAATMEQAAEMTTEYVIPAIGKYDAEVQE